MENYNLVGGTRPIMEHFSELYSLLILISAHWKQSIILRRSTSSYFWKHLVILVEAHGSITSMCSTSMSKCVHKYEMVLLKVWRGASSKCDELFPVCSYKYEQGVQDSQFNNFRGLYLFIWVTIYHRNMANYGSSSPQKIIVFHQCSPLIVTAPKRITIK